MENKLSYQEAFTAMQFFLEKYYEETSSDDIGCLLGEISMNIWSDGSTGDPAAWSEWLQAINKVLKTRK